MIMDMRSRMERMRERVESLEEELEGMRADIEERVRQVRESFRNDIVPVPRGEIVIKRGVRRGPGM